MIEWTLRGTCRRYADVPVAAEIVSVNGRNSIGNCEHCGRAVLEGPNGRLDRDGCCYHMRCRDWRRF